MFAKFQTLVNRHTGQKHSVLYTPNECVIGYGNVPVYVLSGYILDGGEYTNEKTVRVLTQSRVESGDFVLPDQYVPAFPVPAQEQEIGPRTRAAINELNERTAAKPQRGMGRYFQCVDDAGAFKSPQKPDPQNPKFERMQHFQDCSGDVFVILGLPADIRLADCGKPAYSYARIWSGDAKEISGPILVLSQEFLEAPGIAMPVTGPENQSGDSNG